MGLFFFFKQKTAYEIRLSLVGSEMCIRDRMKDEEKGFFEYTNQFSLKNKELFNEMPITEDYFVELDNQKILSINEQLEIESSDTLSFDDFLADYFSSDT